MTRHTEAAVADALGDERVPKEAALQMTERTDSGERWVLKERWASLVRDARLPSWRRLVAADILLSRCLDYPRPLSTFIGEDLAAMGVHRRDVADATILQNVPIARHPDERLLVATLPIATAVGPAAVYAAVNGERAEVTRSTLYPRDDD